MCVEGQAAVIREAEEATAGLLGAALPTPASQNIMNRVTVTENVQAECMP